MIEYKGIDFTEAEFVRLLPEALPEKHRVVIMNQIRIIQQGIEAINNYDKLIEMTAKNDVNNFLPKLKQYRAQAVEHRKRNVMQLQFLLSLDPLVNHLAEQVKSELESTS